MGSWEARKLGTDLRVSQEIVMDAEARMTRKSLLGSGQQEKSVAAHDAVVRDQYI
jgi:hypothetical protein